MWANVYKEDEKQDVNTLSVKVNDTQLEIPGKELVGSNNPNLQEEVRIDNIPVSNNVTLVFSTESATNVKGIRLYDVKLVVAGEGDNGEVIKPEPTN